MFGGRPGFRWWRPPRIFIYPHACVCACVSFVLWETRGRRTTEKGDTGGNNAGLEKLKKRARRAAITSDVSRPNDRHLSGRSRCYAKSPLCHSARAASESYKQTACLRFSFPRPLVSLSFSLSLTPPTPFVFCRRADRFGTRWRTAKTRSTFIPPNLWTFEKFFSTLEFTAGLETRAAGGGIIIVGCVHADAKLCKFLTPRRDEWSGGGGSLKKNSRDSEFCFIFPFFFIRFLIVLGGRRSRRFCSSHRFFSFFYFHQFFETRIVRIFR